MAEDINLNTGPKEMSQENLPERSSNTIDEEAETIINRLKSDLGGFTSEIRTNKNVEIRGGGRFLPPRFATDPATCRLDEIALIGNTLKQCNPANTWVAIEGAEATQQQIFTSSGTWTKPTGAVKVLVQLWGGGGSGAGTDNNTNTIATGGGGGVYVWAWFDADDLSATESVVVGVGGEAVTATSNQNGNNGLNTVFGTLLTANGGSGGIASTTNRPGGDGGKFTGMSFGSPLFGEGVSGQDGEDGLYTGAGGGATGQRSGGDAFYGGAGGGGRGTIPPGAPGGTSVLSGDGGRGGTNESAVAGSTPSGGGGGCNSSTGTDISGAGGDGQAIITTFF